MKAGLKDETDRRLLALLMTDARQPIIALAKKLGMARTTVHERLDRLERTGVIVGYTVLVNGNPSEGYVQSVVLLSIAQKWQKQVVERLRSYPEIKLCSAISGEFDLMLTIEAPQNEDIDAVIDEVNAIQGVERSKTLIILSTKFDRR